MTFTMTDEALDRYLEPYRMIIPQIGVIRWMPAVQLPSDVPVSDAESKMADTGEQPLESVCLSEDSGEVVGDVSEEERQLELEQERLGNEMRPLADVILSLQKEHEKMSARSPLERKDKIAKGKTIQQYEDHFVTLFNRDVCWSVYYWPDGFTVRFLGPRVVKTRDGRLKFRDQQGPPRVRPVFGRRSG
jgi:hypothetical protein